MVVSCVTSDAPHRPHPHNLVGKEGCKKGVCTMELTEAMSCSFPNLGIQCVKKKDIEEFERNIAVLKSYYDDFKDLVGISSKKDAILGLYLLYLLSYNK